jgi:serine/threonine protein phosphatase 1
MELVKLQPEDRLIGLGDYIDSGPDSYSVVEWLLQRQESGGLIALRGNHEQMILRARDDRGRYDDWNSSGGKAMLASYSHLPDGGGLADIPGEHWRFFEQTRPFWETETHLFVHANAYPDMPLEDQPESMLLWEKFNDPPPHESGKILICGHTPQQSGRPRNIGHAVCIDTGAYRNAHLSGCRYGRLLPGE